MNQLSVTAPKELNRLIYPMRFVLHILTIHWGRDKMVANFLTTFSNAFYWMKIYEFRLQCHWSLFPKVPNNHIPALVQIMAGCRPGDKQLSEPIMVNLPTHMFTRLQWVKQNFKTRLVKFVSSWGCFETRIYIYMILVRIIQIKLLFTLFNL